MYKFSAPMPYSIEDIDKLLDINNNIEKSAITTLYANVPRNCELFTGFEQSRNFLQENSWDYWKKLIEHTLSKGIDFVYTLNNPSYLFTINPIFQKQLDRLGILLNELRKIGIKKLRIANNSLISFINKYYSDFDILASTSLEFKTIGEYQNFIEFYPFVKEIVPSHEVNKNFMLLSSLKKRYPNKNLEIMVNEGCLKGCPNRNLHASSPIDDNLASNDFCFSSMYPTKFCIDIARKYPIQTLVIGNHIFPWELDEYKKIGITNFKFAGREIYNKSFLSCLENFEIYLKGIDDYNLIKNYPISMLVHHLQFNSILKKLKIKDYRKYMPNIKYFVKYGQMCASACAIECKYCYKLAEKMQLAVNKQLENEKRCNVPICVIS